MRNIILLLGCFAQDKANLSTGRVQTVSQVFFASTQKLQKTHFKADISCISLADNRLMDVTQLGLGGQTVKNLRRLACEFDLDQSEHKSSQVNTSAHKAWPNGVASRHKLRICFYLRLRLAKASCLTIEHDVYRRYRSITEKRAWNSSSKTISGS